MVVELDNGMRFIANFRYNIKPEVSKDPLVDRRQLAAIDTSMEDKFDMACDSTMVGLVQHKGDSDSLKNFKAVCFVGHQTQKFNIE